MIESLEYHIIDACNLNCAGCSHFSPLVKDINMVTFPKFKKDWDEVHKKGLQIKRIRVLGGEPLLNPNISIMLIYLRKLFPDSDINVVTNGIVLDIVKPNLLPIFISNNISLTISRYPNLDIDYQKVLQGFPKIEMYDKAGFTNISLHKNPDYDSQLAFDYCFSSSVAHCSYLKDGRIYPCPIMPNLPIFCEYFKEDLNDTNLWAAAHQSQGISISDHSIEEIEEYLRTPQSICSFCNSLKAREVGPWKPTERKINEWME